MMTYIGSVDFYDGDFELHAFQAENALEAYAIHKTYVKEHYGKHIKEITKISISDTRYVAKMFEDM